MTAFRGRHEYAQRKHVRGFARITLMDRDNTTLT